jgi:electron transfer flavoprotein-quinone oxidoreductase
MVTHDITRPGLILVGDAAGFTLNAGMTIRGMDLAAGSAIAAVTAITKALDSGDFSHSATDVYRAELETTFAGADMKTYAPAPHFFETERLDRQYGLLLADVMHGVFDHDLTPRRHLAKVARVAVKSSGVRMTALARDGLAAIRAL